MVNTADAYGFPPFQYLAPAIVLGDGGYAEMLSRERAVLTSAVARMKIRRLASDSFTWADTIPGLLAADRAATPATTNLARRVLPTPRRRPWSSADVHSGTRNSAAE